MNEPPKDHTIHILQEAQELQKTMRECFADLSSQIDRLTCIAADMLPSSLRPKD